MFSRVCFSILFVVFGFTSKAQYNDFGLWSGVSIDKKLSKKVSSSYDIQFRLNENYTQLNSVFFNGYIGYKINKKNALGFAYRYSDKNGIDKGWYIKHRLQLRYVFKIKLKPLSFQYRSAFQAAFKKIYIIENVYYPTAYWRNKLAVKIDLDKKYEPYLSAELFYNLNYNNGLNRYRISGGLNWDLPKKMNLKTGYIFQKEINKVNPVTEYIFVIAYSVKI